MAAGNANILIEIGANLLYSIVAQTAPGVPMNLTGYTAAMVVRSALATAAPALLTPTCTFQNAAFSGTISGTTLTLTSATVGTIFTQVTLSTGAVVASAVGAWAVATGPVVKSFSQVLKKNCRLAAVS